MRSTYAAMLVAILNLGIVAEAVSKTRDILSAEANGYSVTLGGEVGNWLASCRYRAPEPFGPFMEKVDWGDGSTSVPDDFDTVSCGNMARHLYNEPGAYRIVITRTAIGGANDEEVNSEKIQITATVKPEIDVDVAEDGTVRISGQIGEVLGLCSYPRRGRAYWNVGVAWGDGDEASSCPDTLSHRYEKSGRYTILIGMTSPGPDDGPVFYESRIDVVIP